MYGSEENLFCAKQKEKIHTHSSCDKIIRLINVGMEIWKISSQKHSSVEEQKEGIKIRGENEATNRGGKSIQISRGIKNGGGK